MYDPILQRPLFQPAASSTQGAGTSVMPKAKGTGITSMVTPPDVAAEQLRSVVNPMKPIVQGFADGGIFGGEKLPPTPYGEQGQNPGWGHEGQPFVMSREKVPLGTGQEYQDWAKQHSNGVDAGITDVASNVASNITGASKVQPVSFNRDSFAGSSNPVTVAATSPYVASNVPSFVPVTPTRYTPVISTPVFPELPFQGGVQRFADGGPATSMWQRFVQSLTVPEPTQIMSGREPIDIGGREAVISPEVYDNMTAPTIEERRAEAKRNIESYEAPPPAPSPAGRYVQGILGLDEAGVAASRQRASEVSKRLLDREEEMRRFEKTRAELQQAREQNPPVSFWDNFSDITDKQVEERNKANRDAQEAILRRHRQEPNALTQLDMETSREAARARGLGSLVDAPAMPKGNEPINIDEGKKTEPQRQATSDVGLNLQQIKADREAKSSADRRENALLALMNAGFAMAAGKSPHALQNIGAGGQAGIQAFAEMEKQRRDTEYKQYLQDLHERELRMRQAEQDIKAPLYKAQAEYYKTRPEAERQRQQVRETAASYAARKEAAQEFMRRKKDDFNFAQQFNNPATGPAMEKEWITRRTQELLPEMLVMEQNKANNTQGNVNPINAE